MKTTEKLTATFIASYADFRDIPKARQSEFCLLGRSNAGKSSFINHAFNNNALAKVAKTPGKTRLANVFQLSNSTIWIDLPGYGFALASQGEKKRWSKLVADYVLKRPNLKGVLWLLDIRHPGQKADIDAALWLEEAGVPALPIFTKCDKESNNGIAKLTNEYSNIFRFGAVPCTYSIFDDRARAKFWQAFDVWSAHIEGVRP
jgi:GTP-binding protein